MAQRIVNNFGQQGSAPASVAQRYWLDALVVAILTFSLGSLVALTLLWGNLPMLPGLVRSPWWHVSGLACSGLHRLVPFMFTDTSFEMRSYLSVLSNNGLSHLLYMRLWIACVAGAALGLTAGWFAAAPVSGITHMRGRQLIEGPAAIRMANSLLAEQVKRLGADFKIHPKITFTREQWSKGVLIFGAIGGGKTTVIQPILNQIFERDDKALIYDNKGGFTAQYPKAALLAPWHKFGIPWAISRDCTTLQDAIEFATQIVEASKDPMWGNAARQVLIGLIVDLQKRKPRRWGWADLYAQFSRTEEEDLQMIMKRCNEIALQVVASKNQTTSGVLINMTAGLQWVKSLADAWGNPKPGEGISFVEWLLDEKTKHRQIILQGNGRFEQMTQGYVSSIIAILSARINSPEVKKSKTRRLWFILDEFPQIGKVKFKPFLEIGREKDVRTIIGLQDINQMIEIYSKETTNSMLSMIGTKVIAQIGSGETAKMVAGDLLGEQEVERSNTSVSGSGTGKSVTVMSNRESLKVMYDSELSYELGNRPDGKGIDALLSNNDMKYAFKLTWPHDNTPDARDSYIEADWVAGGARSEEDFFIEIEDDDLMMREKEPSKPKQVSERAREHTDAEFERMKLDAQARLEMLLGPKPEQRGPDKGKDAEATFSKSKSGYFAATAVSGDAPQSKTGQEPQRRHIAEQARAAQYIAQMAPSPGGEEENIAMEAADAMHNGEGIGHAMGLDHEGVHGVGLLAMAPVIADALRSQTPPTDPIIVAERLKQEQLSRVWRNQDRRE